MTDQYVWLCKLKHEELGVRFCVIPTDKVVVVEPDSVCFLDDSVILTAGIPRCVPLSDTLTIEAFLNGED